MKEKLVDVMIKQLDILKIILVRVFNIIVGPLHLLFFLSLFILLLLISIFLFNKFNFSDDVCYDEYVIGGFNLFDADHDENSLDEENDNKSQEAADENLTSILMSDMITISMSLNPTISDGIISLNIYNDAINIYPQVISIYLYDSNGNIGDLIYQTGLIGVGQRVDASPFEYYLEPGEYDAVAYFTSVNEETGEGMGTAGANVTIIVNQST